MRATAKKPRLIRRAGGAQRIAVGALISILMALPSATVSVFQLRDTPLWNTLSRYGFAWLGSPWFFLLPATIFMLYVLYPIIVTVSRSLEDRRYRRHWADKDPAAANKLAPNYAACLLIHPQLLELRPAGLAAFCNIPRHVARCILRSPSLLLRQDLWPKLEAFLVLPRGYFSRRRSTGRYGGEITRRRLAIYQRMGIVAVSYVDGATDERELARILREVEKIRLADVSGPGEDTQ